ncbi:MAG: hypothetical protein R3E79_14455 [Caldilineaceae bacterium]
MARYDFKLLAAMTDVEIIARGTGVRARHYLNRRYGHGNWRKMKGIALVEYDNGEIRFAELRDEHLDLPEHA